MPGKNGQIAGSVLVRDSRERREHCAAHPWLSRNHSNLLPSTPSRSSSGEYPLRIPTNVLTGATESECPS